MKINRFAIDGLTTHESLDVRFELNDDINIITGRNGSGKTTVLKAMWYSISGNTALITQEIPFKRIAIETDLFSAEIYRINETDVRIEVETESHDYLFEDEFDEDGAFSDSAEAQFDRFVISVGSSVFFPTFRRIEGGFSIPMTQKRSGIGLFSQAKNDIEESLQALSRKLTNKDHTFVSSISTRDIADLLLTKYTQFSEQSNRAQKVVSDTIIESIKAFEDTTTANDKLQAFELIESIKNRIEKLDKERTDILAPIQEIQNVVNQIFKHDGISVGSTIKFGDSAKAVNSNYLSAGEKQMLSFICYNALNRNSVIFIDEPELSLHVDWQRELFKILSNQNTGNQFIIATHSPFIYTKYPEKELTMNRDRGE
ncbi:ATP-binding protein [uncultured Brevundimonas sp.]|uniref:AAA family ATPase n=1 Tax=uncultured Brevundimonas sp. TaxID=213418 RepID=UPI0026167581|nr:ATP-binding protein [uncultured Brevundimonas sp.]